MSITHHRHRRHRRVAAVTTLVTLSALAPAVVASAGTSTICVGTDPQCSHTLADAIAAATDGDTIRLGAGRFDGGVVIDKSLHLDGAGTRRSVVAGGGPVVTVVARPDGTVPTVTLSDLSLTGGTAVGDGVHGRGGGLDIEAAPDGGVGATVRLTRVRVFGNRATATHTSDSPSGKLCPHGFCPFALGQGGGIANSGRLTVVSSRIEDNRVDGRLSDADGGGIYSELGSLTLLSSVVADNHAQPRAIGRFSEGGGIFVNSGDLDVAGSAVVANTADLVTSWPVYGQGVLIDMGANSGGIHIGDGVSASLTHSVVARNRVSGRDPRGEPLVFDSALLVGNSSIFIDRTRFVHNLGYADLATSADLGFSGTAVEVDGPATITRSRISHNRAVTITHTGPAGAGGGLAVYDFSNDPRQVTVSHSAIRDNRSYARSATGVAFVLGGGVFNNSLLTLDSVSVARNRVVAAGASATAQGGGIWNGVLYSGPPVQLTLRHSRIVHNDACAGPDGAATGGGVYTTEPIIRFATVIARNRPDDLVVVTADGQAPATDSSLPARRRADRRG